jgi:N-acyl-D-aspartate/D-glutamate deacylase
MGEAAVGGQANDAQLSKMLQLLHDALDAGALGFSTSKSPTHNDHNGDPVPSRHASDEELIALARATGEHAGTTLEAIVPGSLAGYSEDEIELLTAMSTQADRPINWNVLAVTAMMREQVDKQLAVSDRIAAAGGRLVALTMPHSRRSGCRSSPGSSSTACPAGGRRCTFRSSNG